jgi:hypothetical protein
MRSFPWVWLSSGSFEGNSIGVSGSPSNGRPLRVTHVIIVSDPRLTAWDSPLIQPVSRHDQLLFFLRVSWAICPKGLIQACIPQ